MTSILASDLGRYILDNYTLSSSDPASPWLVAMASDCKYFHFCYPKLHIARLSFFSRVETGLPATVTSLLDTLPKIENFQFHYQELEIVVSCQ